MAERADHDQIAINGRLRVETIDDEVQFFSEFDGWVATVGHKIRGDGLTEAEAKRMAELWNSAEQQQAEIERLRQIRTKAEHFIAVMVNDGDMDRALAGVLQDELERHYKWERARSRVVRKGMY